MNRNVARLRPIAAVAAGLLLLASGFQNCDRGALVLTDLPAAGESLSAAPDPAPDLAFYGGVNLSGGEYNKGKPGAKLYTDYVYPSRAQLAYYAGKGLRVMRVPFDADRLQPQRGGPLSASEFGLLQTIVRDAADLGLIVLLDPHNYGKLIDADGDEGLIGADVPDADFADFWAKTAAAFKAHPNVWFGLMNEPYQQTAVSWRRSAEAAVKAIRATGAGQKILVPGTSWTGAHSWIASGNADAWADFHDTNFAVEVHQYLDDDSSGTHDTCVANSSQRLRAVTEWARARGMRLFLGEIGWADNSRCMSEGDKSMAYLTANRDVWLGYAYWSGGAWLGDYMFSIEPADGADKPQLDVLLRHLPAD